MIKVFTQDDCGPCTTVKNFLSSQGVEFETKNIDHDEEALSYVKDKGYMGTPITETPDGEAISGFDLPKLQELVKNSK